jgi:hypothetical protein
MMMVPTSLLSSAVSDILRCKFEGNDRRTTGGVNHDRVTIIFTLTLTKSQIIRARLSESTFQGVEGPPLESPANVYIEHTRKIRQSYA